MSIELSITAVLTTECTRQPVPRLVVCRMLHGPQAPVWHQLCCCCCCIAELLRTYFHQQVTLAGHRLRGAPAAPTWLAVLMQVSCETSWRMSTAARPTLLEAQATFINQNLLAGHMPHTAPALTWQLGPSTIGAAQAQKRWCPDRLHPTPAVSCNGLHAAVLSQAPNF